MDIRKYYITRKIINTFNIRNKPNTSYLTELLLNSEVFVYKEKQE
jgi:hypothetical protein